MKYADLFAGIGGTRLGLEKALEDLDMKAECVLSSEIDHKASAVYEKNFGEKPRGDIKEIEGDEIPDLDFVMAGFPCQPFSYAGNKEGFGDVRGTLFFDILRVLEEGEPQFFLLENVRGLKSHDDGKTFKTIRHELEKRGYDIKVLILNSVNFGVPQNRKRLYILGAKGSEPETYLQTEKGPNNSHHYKKVKTAEHPEVKEILQKGWRKKYECSKEFQEAMFDYADGNPKKLHGKRMIDYRGGNSIHSWELGIKGECTDRETEFMNKLIENRRKSKFGTHRDGKKLTKEQISTYWEGDDLDEVIGSLMEKGYLSKTDDGRYDPKSGNMTFEVYKLLDPESCSVTVVSSDAHKLGVVQDRTVRNLTPREIARLQGFPDSFELHPDDKTTYKQMGNTVTVPVIEDLAKDLLLNNSEKSNSEVPSRNASMNVIPTWDTGEQKTLEEAKAKT